LDGGSPKKSIGKIKCGRFQEKKRGGWEKNFGTRKKRARSKKTRSEEREALTLEAGGTNEA